MLKHLGGIPVIKTVVYVNDCLVYQKRCVTRVRHGFGDSQERFWRNVMHVFFGIVRHVFGIS